MKSSLFEINKEFIVKKAFKILSLISLLSLVMGCASYQLGSTLDPALTMVYIPTVRSEVSQPGIESIVTSALNSEIQRDGTLKIVPEELATTTIEVVIVDYSQDTIRYQKDDKGRAAEYSMVLKAKVVFKRLKGDVEKSIILSSTFEGDDTFLSGLDTVSAKQRCLPKAAEDLCEQIVDACISVW